MKKKSFVRRIVASLGFLLGTCCTVIGLHAGAIAAPVETQAGTGPTYTLTQKNIIDGGVCGNYSVFDWWYGIDFYSDPLRAADVQGEFLNAYHANLEYATKVTIKINVVSMDSAFQLYYVSSGTSTKKDLKVGQNTLTFTDALGSDTFQFYFKNKANDQSAYIYWNGFDSATTPIVTIETNDPSRSVTITKGTGVSSVYLSTTSTANSGDSSPHSYNQGTTVYGFATLAAGYKSKSGWTKVSGSETPADSAGCKYRIGSKELGSSNYSFGTISADPKTRVIYRNNGTAAVSPNVTLTYDSSTVNTIPAVTKAGYTFNGWNTKADGTGTDYPVNLSQSQINALVLASTNTLYAKWVANNYTATLDKNGGTGGDNSASVTFGQKVPNLTSVPTREGYTFNGYDYVDPSTYAVTHYYDADGKGLANWAVSNNATLKAVWVAIKYSVLIAKGTGVSSVYLSSSTGASSGSSSGSKFAYESTVYGYAVLERGYKPLAGWSLVSGSDNVGGGKYRIGSRAVQLGDEATDFGTINATLGNYGVSILAGAGIDEVFLSANDDGTDLVASDTAFPYDSAVYGYATLKVGYNALASWGDPISGEPNTAGALYKVGKLEHVDVTGATLGTISADPKHYSLTLEGLTDPIDAVYDAYLPDLTEFPVQEGWTFIGYYDEAEGGNQYIDGEGHGVRIWDKNEDSPALFAHWTKDMVFTATGYHAPYDAQAHGVSVEVSEPAEGAVVKYGTTPGVYDLDESPTYTNVGTYTVYYQITATVGTLVYTTVTAQLLVQIDRVDRTNLEDLIDDAHGYYDEINPKYPAIAAPLGTAISDAEDFNLLDNKTLEEINAQIAALQAVIDDARSAYSAAEINAIGDVEYTQASKNLIDQARSVYDSLDDTQKGMVAADVYQILLLAEQTYDAMDKIHAIGDVEYTPESKALIDAARAAYDALNDDQKALVGDDFLQDLVDAEKAYEGMDKIHAIGEPSYTSEYKGRIDAAREYYDALSDDQKTMIDNYADLVKAEQDWDAVDDVVGIINAITAISYGDASRTAIEGARAAYEALTADQKAFFPEDVLQHLVDLEKAYADLVKIHAIGTVEYTEASKALIDDARGAYDALTDAQKALVNEQEYQILLDAEKAYDCKDKIHAIGTVEYTPESKALIDAARAAYDGLSDTQKAFVTPEEVQMLIDAEKAYHVKDLIHTIGAVEHTPEDIQLIADARAEYEALSEAQKAFITEGDLKSLADAEQALVALDKIYAIGDVEFTPEEKAGIDDARAFYDALTDDQKGRITEPDYQKLLDAEKAYESLGKIYALPNPVEYQPEDKALIDGARSFYNGLSDAQKALMSDEDVQKLIDAEKAYEALGKIYAIGDVEFTPEEKAGIEDARSFYNGLSEEQKSLIAEEDLQKLIDAEKAFESLTRIHAIGDPLEHGAEEKERISGAREYYDALSDEQKALMSDEDVQVLIDAEKAYEGLEKIYAIGDVVLTSESKEKIDAAREYYDALSEDQKALVSEEDYQKLVDAEKVYEGLRLIDEIGNVDYSTESKEKIDAAREYYDNLTDEQKAMIGSKPLQSLSASEQQFATMETNATVLVSIMLSFVCLTIVGGVILFCLLLLKRKKENKDGDNGNGGKPAKVSAFSLPILVVLASHYIDPQFVALYILAGLAVLVWLGVLTAFILRKKGKLPFAPKKAEAKPEEKPEPEKEPESVSEPEQEPESEPESAPGPVIAKQAFREEAPASEEAEEEDEEVTVTDAEGHLIRIRYDKSFEAKICQAPAETKNYYRILKNYVLSYKKAKSRISWAFDSVNVGREKILKFSVRGKTLCVYLATNPEGLDPKYKVERAEAAKYAEVPCLYRIRNDRRCNYCKELIDMLMGKLGVPMGKEQNEEYPYPYQSTKALLEQGLVKERRLPVAGEPEPSPEPEPEKAPQSFVEEIPEDADEFTVTDAEGHVLRIRLDKSFTAKMSQATDEAKGYYRAIKNHVLSYKKAKSRISWGFDSFNVGREPILKMTIKGKTLCVYLALDAEGLEPKYKVEKAEAAKYADVPCLYRIRNDRRCDYCKDLIDLLMGKLGIEKGKEVNEEYEFPHQSTQALIEQGLIKERQSKGGF